MTMRSLLPALILVACAACSDTSDAPEAAELSGDATGEETTAPGESAEAETPQETPTGPVREVVSGDVSSLALDMDPAVAEMVGDDGRSIVLEIRTDSLQAVQDSWGGIGTPMRVDCERGEPFTVEDGTTYEYYKDCVLP